MIKKCYRWLISERSSESWLAVIGWWEIRRVAYNVIVGGIGTVSLLLFYLFLNLAGELQPGEDAIEPLALLMAPVLINLAYTCGWMAELFLYFVWRQRSSALGPAFFQLGLSFSVCIVMLPAVFWFVVWVVRSIW